MNAYRVDKRLFRVGDVVTHTGEYLANLDCERALVERHLDYKRPDSKPRRNEVLFVFESRIAAERFWIKVVDGKLYEVKTQGTPLHRGDMNLTEEIFKFRADADHARVLVDRYWGGEESAGPQIELLVQNAVVASVIFTTEPERRGAFAAQAGIQLP
jgi:hypothetical protein